MVDRQLAHYRITSKLGSGGMGEVYRAEDTKLGRVVALKVLPEPMAADADRLSRFTREAKTVAGLNHPNIVTLHSVDESEGLHFLTMELVEGQTLGELLPSRGFPLDRFFELAVPITDAVASAHAQGVVHRDLKPGNVMVTDDGKRVKVLDFGLAKLTAPKDGTDPGDLETLSLTQAGAVVGTPCYMSPEQARGEIVDGRSDIFSLGVMLHEMATGAPPFAGSNSIELLSSVLRDEPPDISEIRPDLPLRLTEVIRHCLEKAPTDRYQTMEEVRDELTALQLELLSATSRPSSAAGAVRGSTASGPGPVPLPARVRTARVLILGAAALVLAAAVALVARWYPSERGGPDEQTPGRRIVAVLPFENLGHSKDEYFADGITDEITSRLALIRGLGVISRTSARVYKDTEKSVREIGAELNADFILAGTIRWDRSQRPELVRITPRLIRVSDDTYVWSDNYERAMTEIFSVQAAIASQIADALDVTLLADERAALSTRPTDDMDAYRAYLRGVEHLNAPGFSRESFTLGIQMFERAVELDPEFALAQSRLSSMHSRMYHYGYDRSAGRLELARQTSDRALALQPNLVEARLAQSHYYYWCKRDYARALAALDAAGEIAPNNYEVWLTTAYVKRRQGELESAIGLFEKGLELSPLDPNAAVGLGETYSSLRRYAEAETALKRGIALAPDDSYPYTELALVYLRWRGDTAAARAVLTEAPQVVNTEECRVWFLNELLDRELDSALDRLSLCRDEILEAGIFYKPTALYEGMTLKLMNQPGRARLAYERSLELLQTRLDQDRSDHRVHAALGLTYAGLGRPEEAVRHARHAVELYPTSMDALQAPALRIDLAMVYTMIGDVTGAVAELDTVLSIPSILSVPWIEADPRWDPLKEHPQYRVLLEKHGSVEGPRAASHHE